METQKRVLLERAVYKTGGPAEEMKHSSRQQRNCSIWLCKQGDIQIRIEEYWVQQRENPLYSVSI